MGVNPAQGEQTRGGSAVDVVQVEPEHIPALAEFFRNTWDPSATPEHVRRARAAAATANPVTPGVAPPTFLFLRDGHAVGHVGTIPVRVWHHGCEQPAHWVKGLMVLPEHRDGPVGFMVLKQASSALGHAIALVVQPAPRKLFQALGYRELGSLSNYLRILRPRRVLRQLDLDSIDLPNLPRWLRKGVRPIQLPVIAPLVGLGLAASARMWSASLGRSRVRSRAHDRINGTECDAIWSRVRVELTASPCRDGHYLLQRYEKGNGKYRFVTVYDADTPVGVGAVREPSSQGDPRLQGIRVATLSEVVFAPSMPAAGLALLAGAERLARRFAADALLCSTTSPGLGHLLRRRAFLRLPGNLFFLVRSGAGGTELPTELTDWWLTRGDSDADEVF